MHGKGILGIDDELPAWIGSIINELDSIFWFVFIPNKTFGEF